MIDGALNRGNSEFCENGTNKDVKTGIRDTNCIDRRS